MCCKLEKRNIFHHWAGFVLCCGEKFIIITLQRVLFYTPRQRRQNFPAIDQFCTKYRRSRNQLFNLFFGSSINRYFMVMNCHQHQSTSVINLNRNLKHQQQQQILDESGDIYRAGMQPLSLVQHQQHSSVDLNHYQATVRLYVLFKET